MPDNNVSPEDFSALVHEIRRLTGGIDQLARGLVGGSGGQRGRSSPTRQHQERRQEEERSRKRVARDRSEDQRAHKAEQRDHKMSRMADHVGRSLAALEGDAGKASHQLQRMVEGVPKVGLTLSAVAGQIISFGGSLTKNYREVADAGQLFQGSMMDMASAAADAGLPMNEFASLVKKNTKLMAIFGVQGVADMAKHVRQITSQQGMYGYSVEGLNEVTMTYLDIQRQFNVKVNRNNLEHARNIAELAKTTTSLAAAFGTTREEILKNTAEAMQEFTALIFHGGEESQATLARKTEAATRVMEVISNIPVIGKDTVKALDTSVRMGTATMDENWRTMASKFPELTVGVDNLAAKIANGTASMDDSVELMVNMRDVLRRNREFIQRDQTEAGQRARELLKQLEALDLGADGSEFKKRKKAEEEAAKAMSGLTKLLTNLESQMKLFGATFLGGIYEGLKEVEKGFNDPAWQKTFAFLKSSFKDAGITIGRAIATVFTRDNVETLGKAIQILADITAGLIKLGAVVLKVWTAFMGGLESIGKKFGKTGEALATVAGLVISAFAFFRAKDALAKMFGLRMKNMVIQAQNVIVNGGMGGGGGGPGGGYDSGNGGGGGGAGGPEGGGSAIDKANRTRQLRGQARANAAKAAKLRHEGRITEAMKYERLAQDARAEAKVLGKAAASPAVGKVLKGGGAGRLGQLGKLGKFGKLGRFGGMLIPGVGAGIDALSAVGAAQSGNKIAASLYGAAAAVNGAGVAADATGIGAIAGIPLDVIGGILSGGGMLSEMTGFGRKKRPNVTASPEEAEAAKGVEETERAAPKEKTVGKAEKGLAGAEKTAGKAERVVGAEKTAMRLSRVPRFLKSPMAMAAMGAMGLMGAAGIGFSLMMRPHEKEAEKKEADKNANADETKETAPIDTINATTLTVNAQQATLTATDRASLELPPSLQPNPNSNVATISKTELPALPRSPAADLLTATRQQTRTLEQKLGDVTEATSKDDVDPYSPQMIRILDSLRNMEEAQLLMQKQMLDIMKKSAFYQADAKQMRDRKNMKP